VGRGQLRPLSSSRIGNEIFVAIFVAIIVTIVVDILVTIIVAIDRDNDRDDDRDKDAWRQRFTVQANRSASAACPVAPAALTHLQERLAVPVGNAVGSCPCE